MPLASRRDVHFAFPGMQHCYSQMRRRAEAEQSHALAWFDAGHAQAAEADNAGAEQRRGVNIVEACGQRENEIPARECVFGVAAVDGVAGKRGRIAKIFLTSAAIRAGAVDSADPGDTHSRSKR